MRVSINCIFILISANSYVLCVYVRVCEEHCTRIWVDEIIRQIVMLVKSFCACVCVSRYWVILVSNERPGIPSCSSNGVPQMRKYHKILFSMSLVNKCWPNYMKDKILKNTFHNLVKFYHLWKNRFIWTYFCSIFV